MQDHPVGAQRARIAAAAASLWVIVVAMVVVFGDRSADDAHPEGTDDARPVVAPVAGGTTHHVATAQQWTAAVAAARPGDVIRLTATISEPLTYRGDNDGGTATGSDGTASAPIVITADAGVWIDGGGVDNSHNLAVLNLWYVDHVHAVGLSIRNGQYGIRCLQCHGSAEAPLRIADNRVTSVGYVGIHVGGHLSTHAPSSHVTIDNNLISATGRKTPEFGEGIYLGHGGTEWVDETSNIIVSRNDVSHTTAEAIDIKPGTREIVVEDNLLHEIAPIYGGAISAHYVHILPNPKPSELDRVVIQRNRIWNHNLNGAHLASDAAIWVGHGGVEILDNTVWGFRIHYNTRGVRVQGRQSFGPHPIRIEGNTFWLERAWVTAGYPDPSPNVVSSGNRGPAGTTAEITVTAADFVGPIPAIGSGGAADAGSGPGSALALVVAPASTGEYGTPGTTVFQEVPATASTEQPPPVEAPPVDEPSTDAPPIDDPAGGDHPADAPIPTTIAPPVTEPPVTDAPPTTEPPATTAAPTTEAPATTAAPTTEAPVMEAAADTVGAEVGVGADGVGVGVGAELGPGLVDPTPDATAAVPMAAAAPIGGPVAVTGRLLGALTSLLSSAGASPASAAAVAALTAHQP